MKTRLRLTGANKITLLIAGVLLIAAVGLKIANIGDKLATSGDVGVPKLVIDPGHGGIDGGALAEDGTKESVINLAVSNKLCLVAQLFGVDTVMTRTDDTAYTESTSYSERGELQHRVDIINGTENAVYMSIHQNYYPTGQPSGPQVMYARDDVSMAFGNIAQTNLISQLDTTNRRVAVPASEKLYISSNAKYPGILVECGFMSNMWDVQKLCDETFQCSLAVVMAASFLQFCAVKTAG